MALTNFGKVIVSAIGMGLVGVFMSAAAPAFADTDADVMSGIPTHSAQVIAAAEGHGVPKLNLLLLPGSPVSETKIG